MSLLVDKQQLASVTLRCEPRSGEPRRVTAPESWAVHSSRLASLAPQDDGSGVESIE
jgi:hypothetical protein